MLKYKIDVVACNIHLNEMRINVIYINIIILFFLNKLMCLHKYIHIVY